MVFVGMRRQRNWWCLVVGSGKQDYFVLAVDLAVHWTWSEDSGHFRKRRKGRKFRLHTSRATPFYKGKKKNYTF